MASKYIEGNICVVSPMFSMKSLGVKCTHVVIDHYSVLNRGYFCYPCDPDGKVLDNKRILINKKYLTKCTFCPSISINDVYAMEKCIELYSKILSEEEVPIELIENNVPRLLDLASKISLYYTIGCGRYG